MISWIQHHLIRHGRWVFLSLLAVIIVAFVFTIGNTPGCTTDRSGYEENLYYGIDLELAARARYYRPKSLPKRLPQWPGTPLRTTIPVSVE
jgi:hypothetical protein